MTKKAKPVPSRTCADCFHCQACHLWSGGAISVSVAPKCPQFEPVRYVSLADLHEMHQMAKGELVPVKHGRWKRCFEDWRHQLEGDECSACGFQHYGMAIDHYLYCPNCGARMDAKGEDDAAD